MTSRLIKNNNSIEIVNRICAGIDIHRDKANVTLLSEYPDGSVTETYREYLTKKSDIVKMKNWLISQNCFVIGMESTGKYWQPVHNVMEEEIDVILYNARNIKNIPGKKTDKSDSKWIANITRHGLMKGSFIPCKQIRDAKLISRTRSGYLQSRTMFRQTAHGILQSAGIKLSSHMSDIFGRSGLNLMRIIVQDEPYDEEIIRSKVFGCLKHKAPILMESMEGSLRPTHRQNLSHILTVIESLTRNKEYAEDELKKILIVTEEHQDVYKRLQGIPGLSSISALLVLAEIGYDLDSFSCVKCFCSWAGLCPGNKESAGKRLGGKVMSKKHHLKTLLIEIAWVSVKMRNTPFPAWFAYYKARKGPQKAIVVIAHKLSKIIYAVVKHGVEYDEHIKDRIYIDQVKRSSQAVKKIIGRIGIEQFKSIVDEVKEN